MKKIIYILLFSILFIILFINIFSLLNTSLFGFRIYKVGSGSMEPSLKINDLIIIRSSDDYKVQDIITYSNENEYITHRIISIKGNEVTTKGDANNISDEPITKDKIIGKLIYKFHVFSFMSYLFYKPGAWILIFIVGIILVYIMPDKKIDTN